MTASKRVQRPEILLLLMPENVYVVVVGAYLKAAVPHSIPLVKDFFHLIGPPVAGLWSEPEGSLVSSIAGVTFDFEE